MNLSLAEFIGSKVFFGVSDPWDFSIDHKDKLYSAIIKAASRESLLLELQLPLNYKGVTFKYLVATARHKDKNLKDITSTDAVPVNLTPAIVPKELEATDENLFDAAKAWRGWHLIGGLRLT